LSLAAIDGVIKKLLLLLNFHIKTHQEASEKAEQQ